MSASHHVSPGRVSQIALPWLLLIAALLWHGPIAQDPAYHLFADRRAWLGLSNGQNTWSNLPFLLAGTLRLWRLRDLPAGLRPAAWVMVSGLLAVGFGSAWYHLDPNDQTLVWDRLPISIAFAGAMGLIATDQISQHTRRWLWLLISVSVLSVGFWAVTGDLRLYVLVQFGGLLWILQCLWFGQGGVLRKSWLWSALACYMLAKVFEMADAWCWQLSAQQWGGHMVKHVLAGLGAFCLVSAMPGVRRLRQL